MGKARQITFQGVTYQSMREAITAYAERWNVCHSTAAVTLYELIGFKVEKPVYKKKTAMVDGVIYDSVTDAAKSLSKSNGNTVRTNRDNIYKAIAKKKPGYQYM